MGNPNSEIVFGIPLASSDGKYYSRYPNGDRFAFIGEASGDLATALSSAPSGIATAVTSDTRIYYAGPGYGYVTPTIYAAPTARGLGNGSSEANAMAFATALALAVAGDIIGLVPGVYTGVGRGRGDEAAFVTTNSGTALNPILIVAKYSAVDLIGKLSNSAWTLADGATVMAHPDRTEFRHNGILGAGAGSGSPAFGSVSRSYVHWIGVCADEITAAPHSNTGLSLLWGTTGSRIARCVLVARDPGYNGSPIPVHDNHPNVRLESATNCVVEDNALLSHHAGPTHNHCSVQRYESVETLVQNNFCQGSHTGIYMKDQDTSRRETIRYNYAINPHCGIEVLNVNIDAPDSDLVYQNLLVGAMEALHFQSRANNVQAYNNTIISPAPGGGAGSCWAAHHSGSGCYLRDSILIATSGSTFIDQSYRTAPVNVSNHNRYFRTGTLFTARYNGMTRTSIEAWRTATGQDLNSTVGAPGFVDQLNGNYKLAADSPCLALSSTGGPLGCYITGTETIGPRYRT